MQVFPVIHFRDPATCLEQAELAHREGADGVFLISHQGDDDALVRVAAHVRQRLPETFRIGINLLSRQATQACQKALEHDLNMVWADHMGVGSGGLSEQGHWLSRFAKEHPNIALYASVAFKYQALEPHPPLAARHALEAGFIPTTSGSHTGSAPSPAKIQSMSAATGGVLAVASGMTAENLAEFKPHLSAVLVATGIGQDNYRMDPGKLRAFLGVARR
jgi:predicted TIM-barrel enzyme